MSNAFGIDHKGSNPGAVRSVDLDLSTTQRLAQVCLAEMRSADPSDTFPWDQFSRGIQCAMADLYADGGAWHFDLPAATPRWINDQAIVTTIEVWSKEWDRLVNLAEVCELLIPIDRFGRLLRRVDGVKNS